MDLTNKLKVARIASAGDGAERGTPENPVRIVQRRGVRNIEHFRAKLKAYTLADPKCFSNHQIRLLQARTAYWIPRARTDDELRSSGKGRHVEVLRNNPIRELVRIADSIGP